MNIADNISWKKLQDKVVAVNLTTGTYYTLNPVASAMWNLMAEGKTPQEIVSAIAEEYDCAESEIMNDFNDQVKYWKKESLLMPD